MATGDRSAPRASRPSFRHQNANAMSVPLCSPDDALAHDRIAADASIFAVETVLIRHIRHRHVQNPFG